jgi:hypothetical protein
MSKTLGLCGIIDRLDILPTTLPSLMPHFDAVHFLVDTRAPATVGVALTGLDVPWSSYVWVDSFADACNRAVDAVATDWIFQLDCDEDVTGAETLRHAVTLAEARHLDLWWIPRRHWWDIERTRQRTDPQWWPDRQCRLRRREIRLAGRCHPQPIVAPERRGEWDAMIIEHLNLALRSDADWQRINAFYDYLMALAPA